MPYFIKEKIDLRDLAFIGTNQKMVVIADPEEYLLALYSYHLGNNNFLVKCCNELNDLTFIIETHFPSLLIFSPHFFSKISIAADFLKKLQKDFPDLKIIVVCNNITGAELRGLISSGNCVGHIERRFSKPKDLVHIVRAVLN